LRTSPSKGALVSVKGCPRTIPPPYDCACGGVLGAGIASSVDKVSSSGCGATDESSSTDSEKATLGTNWVVA
jgi:hypothetical protein